MADPITDFNSAKSALTNAINDVTKDGGESGASDKWLNKLNEKAQANEDEEAVKKVKTLQVFDAVLRSSIQDLTDESKLGKVVSEVRGYKDLTDRFFAQLRRLTTKDQDLENQAVDKRKALFTVLDQVQQWLLEEKQGVNPSEFGVCTGLFLTLLTQLKVKPQLLSWTQQLFKNQSLDLQESEVRTLTDTWGDVVSTFVEDTQDTAGKNDPLKIGDPVTIADYFCIHDRLETLYARLGTNVSLVN